MTQPWLVEKFGWLITVTCEEAEATRNCLVVGTA